MPSRWCRKIKRLLGFFCNSVKTLYLCGPILRRQSNSLRYGVMVALQILALSVRVRILLSQLNTLIVILILSSGDRPGAVFIESKTLGGL